MRKILPLVLVLCGLLFYDIPLNAQQKTVTGTVLSGIDNVPLAGVTVAVKGTTTITQTDANGKFSVMASTGQSLQFTFVGFSLQEVVIGTADVIDVTLLQNQETLSDVVVVGYGTQRRGNLTGAVTTVDMSTLGSRPVADAGRGLQGVVPGLSVRIPSGEVGSDPLMRIRGFIGSIQGSSAPLILVDNVEIPSIQMINPSDIESITVLKDAAASSIYGSKAAFGVILITTKRGSRTEGVNLSYTNNFSFQ